MAEHRIGRDTTKRVPGTPPYRGRSPAFLAVVVVDAVLVVATRCCSADRRRRGRSAERPLVVRLALIVAALAVADGAHRRSAAVLFLIGEGLYDLRTEVFAHVQRQPVAFFTRAQTGALVARLNSDVIGAQQAFTSVLGSVVSNAISLVLIVAAMASLSWQLTLGALLLLPSSSRPG